MMMAMDELNVIQSSKTLYDKLEAMNEAEFLKLAQARFKDITGEDAVGTISPAWLLLLLSQYDPTTEYVYLNEVGRKQERFAEAVFSSANKLAAIARAAKLWINQTAQFTLTVERAAVLEAYKKMGVKRVQWFTQPDERKCPECKSMHGNIYDIDKVPPAPHHRCRCYLVPVE